MLGHEIGHVLARHSSERLAKQQLTQGLISAVVVGSGDYTSAQIAQMAGSMINMKYGREDELESDALGMRIAFEAGYDPRAMAGVMEVLAQGLRRLEAAGIRLHPPGAGKPPGTHQGGDRQAIPLGRARRPDQVASATWWCSACWGVLGGAGRAGDWSPCRTRPIPFPVEPDPSCCPTRWCCRADAARAAARAVAAVLTHAVVALGAGLAHALAR